MRDHPRAINRICEQVSKQPKFQAHKGKKKKNLGSGELSASKIFREQNQVFPA